MISNTPSSTSKYVLCLLLMYTTSVLSNTPPWCQDTTDSFNVTVKGVTTDKNCNWVDLKKSRCYVHDLCGLCPITCDFCHCINNDGAFDVMSTNFQSGQETKTCDWVKEDPIIRCSTNYTGTAYNCPLYCGLCPEANPSVEPSSSPIPSMFPSSSPSSSPSSAPSFIHSNSPSVGPSHKPSSKPSVDPSLQPSVNPSGSPTTVPSLNPSSVPSFTPSSSPSLEPRCEVEEFFGKVFYYEVIKGICLKIDLSLNGTIGISTKGGGSCSATGDLKFDIVSTFDSVSNHIAYYIGGSNGWDGQFEIRKDNDLPDDLELELITFNLATRDIALILYSSFCYAPSLIPSATPSATPSNSPSFNPTDIPSAVPSLNPSNTPTQTPSTLPSLAPSSPPSSFPTSVPTLNPSTTPSTFPSNSPSLKPSLKPSIEPTDSPTVKLPCSIDEYFGKSYYFEILGGLCMRLQLYQGGYLSTADSKFSSCSPTAPLMFSDISLYNETIDDDLVIYRGDTLIDGWTGQFSFKKVLGITGVHMNILEQNGFMKVLRAELLTTSCVAPSAAPSLTHSAMPTLLPSASPSSVPTRAPSAFPSSMPTSMPSLMPSLEPSAVPSLSPSLQPSLVPSAKPTSSPSNTPTSSPSLPPSLIPSLIPSLNPSSAPSSSPSSVPTNVPSAYPTSLPTRKPSSLPSLEPSTKPSLHPSSAPSYVPSAPPSSEPTASPSAAPSSEPIASPSLIPSGVPSMAPSSNPSAIPSLAPTKTPSSIPSSKPSHTPTLTPTMVPSVSPTEMPSVFPSAIPTKKASSSPTLFPCQIDEFVGRDYYLRIPSLFLCLKIEMYIGGFMKIDSNSKNKECTSTSTSSSTLSPFLPYVNSTDEMAYFSRSGGWSGSIIFKVDDTVATLGLKELQLNPAGMSFYIELTTPGCLAPSTVPTSEPSSTPSLKPISMPSAAPSANLSKMPSAVPSSVPSHSPYAQPSSAPSFDPSSFPSVAPSKMKSMQPSSKPSAVPTNMPSLHPFEMPSVVPSNAFSASPTIEPRCGVEEVVGKTYYVNIATFGTTCVKFELFPGGLVSIDPNNKKCSRDTSDPSSLQKVTSYKGTSGDGVLFEANPSLGVHYEGQLDFVLGGAMGLKSLTLDHSRLTFAGRITLPSCSAPSNIPSIVPSLLPTMSPSIYPTDFPTTIPSLPPTNIPTAVPSKFPSDRPSMIPSETPTLICNVPHPSWVGDGKCDDDLPNYYTEKCNWDGGDCDVLNSTYPLCPGPLSWISDCLCDTALNTTECGHDGGDCIGSTDGCQLKRNEKGKLL